jgi:hypothetical protein
MENVSHEAWLDLLRRSDDLQRQAAYAKRTGQHDRSAAIWQTLRPLNQRIRALSQMPASPSSGPAWLERRG